MTFIMSPPGFSGTFWGKKHDDITKDQGRCIVVAHDLSPQTRYR